jgi:tRNA nucleotidyltransferase/poly(A) polymerase
MVYMHTLSLSQLPFVRALQQQGGRVYLVGGTLRDRLLGKTHKDLDLLVSGLPQNTLIRLLRPHGRVQLIGRAFGVIKFLPRQWDDLPIDIALPRTEISTGSGHRDFEVAFDHTLPIETDLERRDFTINAMALDLADNQLLDPFGGYQDLQQRRLRQVSPLSFPEDPLRMLRGIQFAARFGLHVEPTTHQAMRTHAAAIATVAPERIAAELRKLLQAPAPSHGFYLMHATGLLPHILPELALLAGPPSPLSMVHDAQVAAQPLFARTMCRLDVVQHHDALLYRGDLNLLLAALWWDCGLAKLGAASNSTQIAAASVSLAQERLEVLRLTMIGAQPDLITTLLTQRTLAIETLASDATLRHLAHRLGNQATFMVLDLHLAERLSYQPPHPFDALLAARGRLQAEIDRQTPLQLKDLAINGHDLQRLGVPAGPHLGQLLKLLLLRVLDDPACNTRDALGAMAQAAWQAEQSGSAPESRGQT